MRYFEVFGEGGFHSAFLTTYAFGPLAFEDIPFPKLRGAGCRNITVLADQTMVNQAFAEYGPPRFAGTSYHLIKVTAPGAFHPKITLLIGESKGRLFVGSANLTALGLGGNKEQVASLSYSSDTPENARFFAKALRYLRRYVPHDDPWFNISWERALRSAPWLRMALAEDNASADGTAEIGLLLDQPDLPLLDQIVAMIGDDPINRLVIVSPYWDAKLEGLARLKAGLGNPVTDLLIDSQVSGFPAAALSRFSDVSLFDVGEGAGGRLLHAKLFIAQGARFDHVISGSMNCSFPALMGPAFGGNAEAAFYKRVARGAALESLGLQDYLATPLHADQLVQLQQLFETPDALPPAVDGGTLVLQAGQLTWTAPADLSSSAGSLQLYDRESSPVAVLSLGGKSSASLPLPSGEARPKYGVVTFDDGSVSAPVQVIDLDYLAVTTQPARHGRMKQLMDTLAEPMHEDLILIEALNQLEALEQEDGSSQPLRAPGLKSEAKEDATPTYTVLSYDDYIRARKAAHGDSKPFGLYLNSRSDSAASLLSTGLNQLIGLVGPDLAWQEEADIEAGNAIDFRSKEPQSPDGDEPPEHRSNRTHQARVSTTQPAIPASKFLEAVVAFEARCKAFADQNITTSEMIRLRALLQIILSFAQPVSGSPTPTQILPVYTDKGYDWPRLVGRLLRQHFGVTRALQNLSVEPDESEQQRVLEYLAMSNWAAQAALQAVTSHRQAQALRVPLEQLLTSLRTQTKAIFSAVDDEADRSYYEQITMGLSERFGVRLGLSAQITILI